MPRIPRFGRSGTATTPTPAASGAASDHDDSAPTVIMDGSQITSALPPSAGQPEAAPADATLEAPTSPGQGAPAGAEPASQGSLGFAERSRARRRLRFLRRARELGYRDLGGLVFDLHRFGRKRDDLVAAKVHTLAVMDQELRALETLLRERRNVTVLHEPGIVACPRCAAIHGVETNFCPNCGLPTRGRADMPMAVPGAEAAPAAAQTAAPAPAAGGTAFAPGATSGPAGAGAGERAFPPANGADERAQTAFPPAGSAGGEAPGAEPRAAGPHAPDPATGADPAGEPGNGEAVTVPASGPDTGTAGLEPGAIGAGTPAPSVWRAPSPVPGSGASAGDDRPLAR